MVIAMFFTARPINLRFTTIASSTIYYQSSITFVQYYHYTHAANLLFAVNSVFKKISPRPLF